MNKILLSISLLFLFSLSINAKTNELHLKMVSLTIDAPEFGKDFNKLYSQYCEDKAAENRDKSILFYSFADVSSPVIAGDKYRNPTGYIATQAAIGAGLGIFSWLFNKDQSFVSFTTIISGKHAKAN